jgi:hypothetical protein
MQATTNIHPVACSSIKLQKIGLEIDNLKIFKGLKEARFRLMWHILFNTC